MKAVEHLTDGPMNESMDEWMQVMQNSMIDSTVWF